MEQQLICHDYLVVIISSLAVVSAVIFIGCAVPLWREWLKDKAEARREARKRRETECNAETLMKDFRDLQDTLDKINSVLKWTGVAPLEIVSPDFPFIYIPTYCASQNDYIKEKTVEWALGITELNFKLRYGRYPNGCFKCWHLITIRRTRGEHDILRKARKALVDLTHNPMGTGLIAQLPVTVKRNIELYEKFKENVH